MVAAYFSCVIKVLYNLLYFQCLAQLSCGLSEECRTQWSREEDLSTLEGCLGLLISSLEPGQLFLVDPGHHADTNGKKQLETDVQMMCLPFLRLATLLRHHLYGESGGSSNNRMK